MHALFCSSSRDCTRQYWSWIVLKLPCGLQGLHLQRSRHVHGTFSRKQLSKHCHYLCMIIILSIKISSGFVKRKNMLDSIAARLKKSSLHLESPRCLQFVAERLSGSFRFIDLYYIFSAQFLVPSKSSSNSSRSCILKEIHKDSSFSFLKSIFSQHQYSK